MPQDRDDVYADGDVAPPSQRLTNADFRKLLMTPRQTPATSAPAVPGRDSSGTFAVPDATPQTGDRAEQRKKKKSFYAKLKKQEDDKMAELAEKYRDRARERRDGANPDYQSEDPMNTANAYRAVAPDLKSGLDAAERRRQMIQESKFLGGDMEHTHLVKGLDYALLQKVRSEIVNKEQEQEREMEELAMKAIDDEIAMREKAKKDAADKEEEMNFKTKIGRDVYRITTALKSRFVERNELFAPRRMAYVVDLKGDELCDTDIPTTLIRSKAEIPDVDTTPTLSTNDLVINKLAQILTYLRQGNRHKGKKSKKDKNAEIVEPPPPKEIDTVNDSIYGDIGDYVPARSSKDTKEKPRKDKADERATDKRRNYFEKKDDDAVEIQAPAAPSAASLKNMISKSQKLLNRLAQEPEGYAECYPGLEEMQDAIDDSDDEVDYTKMDLGNKKGPIGRWDFDTQEEYSDYMNNKEALPKAAFQYGVKMADGRRTRKHKDKNEKAALDREWQQIQNIIEKRKVPKGDTAGSAFKSPRY